MQKYLKEMSEKSKLKDKVELNSYENKTVTFTDL